MKQMSAQELIVTAAERLTVAEGELAAALGDTPKQDRADKLMVSDRLRLALAEILAAKRALSLLLDANPRLGGPPIAVPDDSDLVEE
jgi:hypothetical protein